MGRAGEVDRGRLAVVDMKLRTLAPAFVAAALLVVLYLKLGRHDESTPSAPAPTATTGTQPRVPPSHAAPRPTVPETSQSGDLDDELARKPPLPDDIKPTQGPPTGPKKPAMTLDEKLAETQKHIDVMDRRAALVDKEIAALERDGKKQEAAEQRIVVTRLRAHMEELRKAVAERREPQ
jgi:hypothetical protein